MILQHFLTNCWMLCIRPTGANAGLSITCDGLHNRELWEAEPSCEPFLSWFTQQWDTWQSGSATSSRLPFSELLSDVQRGQEKNTKYDAH